MWVYKVLIQGGFRLTHFKSFIYVSLSCLPQRFYLLQPFFFLEENTFYYLSPVWCLFNYWRKNLTRRLLPVSVKINNTIINVCHFHNQSEDIIFTGPKWEVRIILCSIFCAVRLYRPLGWDTHPSYLWLSPVRHYQLTILPSIQESHLSCIFMFPTPVSHHINYKI